MELDCDFTILKSHVESLIYHANMGANLSPFDYEIIRLWEIYNEQPQTWETVKEWERRTGMVYPDDGPVWYYRLAREPKKREWVLKQFKNVKKYYNCGVNDRFIIANHLGKPPEDWRPE